MRRTLFSAVTVPGLFLFVLLFSVVSHASSSGPTVTAGIPAGSGGVNGAYEVQVFNDGVWKKSGAIFCNQNFIQRQLPLQGVAQQRDGSVRIKLIQSGGGMAHIDAVALNREAPIMVEGLADGLKKLSRKDFDVADATRKEVLLTFPWPGDTPLFTITARVEPEIISKAAFVWPKENQHRPTRQFYRFFTYQPAPDTAGGDFAWAPSSDDQVIPFFTDFSRTGTGHPAGFTYGWVRNDQENLYVRLDFTPDNTMDGDADYAKVFIKTDAAVKEFAISESQTRWGTPGFLYNDKVAYQHKVYDFTIPWQEIGRSPSRNLELAFSAYGTAGVPVDYEPALAYGSVSNTYLTIFRTTIPGGQDTLFTQLIDGSGKPLGHKKVIFESGLYGIYNPAVAYSNDSDSFLVVWVEDAGGSYALYGQLINGQIGALIGTEFLIDSDTAYLDEPALAYSPASQRFLVAWSGQKSGSPDIAGQLVENSGALDGGPFVISNDSNGQYAPELAYDPINQRFLTVWSDSRNGFDIYGRLVNSNGTMAGNEFVISAAAEYQFSPQLAFDPTSRRFLVGWLDERNVGTDLYGQIVNDDGTPFGSTSAVNFPITNDSAGNNLDGALAISFDWQNGKFLAIWGDDRNNGTDEYDIFGRFIDSSGILDSAGDFPIVEDSVNYYESPVLAFNFLCGSFLAAFKENNPTDSSSMISLARIGPSCPGIWANSQVWGWGIDEYGQLGNGGSRSDSHVPLLAPGLGGTRSLSGGWHYTLALQDDGMVKSWGQNNYGQLGNFSVVNQYGPVDVLAAAGREIAGGAAGAYHSVALVADGTVIAWGRNNSGQLGNGTTDDSNDSVIVSGLDEIVAVAVGESHSLALTKNGSVYAWGRNSSGQLGDGTNVGSNVPVLVDGLTDIVAIACGDLHSLALGRDGTVWAWGFNGEGQLGNGTNVGSNVPVQVSGLTGIIDISTLVWHSLALKRDGTVWAWGRNDYGALGDGTTTNRNEPVQVSGLTDIMAVSAGGWHSLALHENGTGSSWGRNVFGQLGDNSTTESHSPVAISGLTDGVALVGGMFHSTALQVENSSLLRILKSGSGDGYVRTLFPNAIDCGFACTALFNDSTVVTLEAVGGAGMIFIGWQGDPDCNDSQVTMDSFKTCIAVFEPDPDSPVSILPAGIDFGAVDLGQQSVRKTFSIVNLGNESVQVTAANIVGPDAAAFTMAENGCGRTLAGMQKVTEYNGHYYLITHEPAGIQWGNAMTAAQQMGGYLATVSSAAENSFLYTLADDDRYWYVDDAGNSEGPWLGGVQTGSQPNPSSGWGWSNLELLSYVNWASGEPSDGGGGEDGQEDFMCLFNLGASRGDFWNDLPGSAMNNGYIIEFDTDPTSCFIDVSFTPDDATDYDAELLVSTDSSLVPELRALLAGEGISPSTWDLSVEFEGDGRGVVTSSPAGIACSINCTVSFPADSTVTLTAVGDTDSLFTGWLGDCSGNDSCTLTMDQERRAAAFFILLDSDNDSLLDSWEMQWFGNLDAEPADDPDGDGITNLNEFLAGNNSNPIEVTIGFAQTSATVNENTSVNLRITLFGGRAVTPVTVDYTISGTATEADYIFPGTGTTGTITIEPGEFSKQVEVEIVSDDLPEPQETLIVRLSAPGVNTILDPGADTAVLTIPANGHNPVVGDRAFTIDEDTTLAITLTGNDSDNDGLQFEVVDNQTNGTLTGTLPDLIFTPGEDDSGIVHFTYKAEDATGLESNIGLVTITITPVNDAPVADDQLVYVLWNEFSYSGNYEKIILSATDAENDSIVYGLSSQPGHGTVTPPDKTPVVFYRPAAGYVGTDSFLFTATEVSDNDSVGTGTITIRVTDNLPPEIPVLVSPEEEKLFAPGTVITLDAGPFSDPENDPHYRSIWQVRTEDGYYRFQEGLFKNAATVWVTSGDSSSGDMTRYSFPGNADILTDGVRIYWRVGYMDNDSKIARWSVERSFQIGTLTRRVIVIPSGVASKDFAMISVTRSFLKPAAEEVLGPLTEKNGYDKYFRIGTYNPLTNSYTEYGQGLEIAPGRAYWFLARNGASPDLEGNGVTLARDIEVKLLYNDYTGSNTAANTTGDGSTTGAVSGSSTSAVTAAANTTGNGWNMVAPPNASDYYWHNLKVGLYRDGYMVAGYPLSLDDSSGLVDDIIDRRAWSWTKGTFGYTAYHAENDPYLLIRQNSGIWVRALQEGVVLIFPVEAQEGGSDNSTATGDNSSLTAKWRVLQKWMRNLLAGPEEAVADNGDGPPLPMSSLESDGSRSDRVDEGGGGGGCFIGAAGEYHRQWRAGTVAVFILLVVMGAVIIGPRRMVSCRAGVAGKP